MAEPSEILTAFRRQMVDAGIARKPGDGPQPGDPPPMFVEPDEGPLAPGDPNDPDEDDPTLVVSIFWGGAIPATYADAYRLRCSIDVRFRTAAGDRATEGVQRASRVAAAMRAEMFEPGDSPGLGRTAWMMGGLPVIQTGELAGYQRLSASPETGYDYVWKPYIEAYA